MSSGRKTKLPYAVRWIHTYLSVIAFATLVFFSATGLTLNHAEWFEEHVVEEEFEGEFAAALLTTPTETQRRLAIVAEIRDRHDLDGFLSDARGDGPEWDASLRRPGYSADVVVDETTRSYSVYVVRQGAVGVANDLHKGRDSNGPWKWLIDISAVLLIAVGITGLWLLLYLKKIRMSGLILTLAGGLVLVVVLMTTL